jgi:hypothetical protein
MDSKNPQTLARRLLEAEESVASRQENNDEL